MRHSDSLVNLAAALSKAQGQFEAAKKDHIAKVTSTKGEGSSYSYNYADLASVLESVREPLAKNGLSVAQFPVVNESLTNVSVTTYLFHESGEFMESEPLVMPVSVDMRGAQALGGAITFARRYAVSAILCIATEVDDDANAASGNQAETAKKEPLPPCPKCHTNKSTIIGKPEFGGGFVCYKKKNDGCGHTWQADTPAAPPANGTAPSAATPPHPKEFSDLKTTLIAMGVHDGNKEHANALIGYGYEGATLSKCAKDAALCSKVIDGLIDRSKNVPVPDVYAAAMKAAGIEPAAVY